jgi:hypothetical protein
VFNSELKSKHDSEVGKRQITRYMHIKHKEKLMFCEDITIVGHYFVQVRFAMRYPKRLRGEETTDMDEAM